MLLLIRLLLLLQIENVNNTDKFMTLPNDICLFVNRTLTDEEKIAVRIYLGYLLLILIIFIT